MSAVTATDRNSINTLFNLEQMGNNDTTNSGKQSQKAKKIFDYDFRKKNEGH